MQRKQFLICSPNKEEEFECLYVKKNCFNENKTNTVHSHILFLVLVRNILRSYGFKRDYIRVSEPEILTSSFFDTVPLLC